MAPARQAVLKNCIASFLDEPEAADSDDDWEYEYSTTEFETHYVTLDLTNPADPPKRTTRSHAGRGGPLVQWSNIATKRAIYVEHHPTEHRWSKKLKLSQDTEKAHDSEVEDADEDDAEDGGKLDEPFMPEPVEQLKSSGLDSIEQSEPLVHASVEQRMPSVQEPIKQQEPIFTGDAKTTNGIQILDLHTHNPLVSYQGNVYSCQWAENQGTEFLLTLSRPEEGLPAMRTLPGGVGLLGAISARIVSSPAHLTKKATTPSPSPASPKKKTQPRNNDPSLRIPVGIQVSARRKDQARFLERLIDLKEELGEADRVTVYAQKRLMNSQWRVKIKSLRLGERARLNRTISSKVSAEEVDAARQELRLMDEEEANKPAPAPKNKAKSGRKKKLPPIEGASSGSIIRRPIRAANVAQRKFGITLTADEDDAEQVASASTPRVRFAESNEEFAATIQDETTGEDKHEEVE